MLTPKRFGPFFPNREIITIRCNDAPKAGGITKDLAEVAAPAEAHNPRQIAAGEVFALPKRARRQVHRLISKVAWPKGGRVNDSSSSLFGAKSDTVGTTVTKDTPQERELVKAINHMLIASTKGRYFVWSTLLIEVGTVGRRRGCGDAEGVCLSFQH